MHIGWHTVFIRMGIYIHTYACMLVGTLYLYVWVYIYIRMHACWLAHCIYTYGYIYTYVCMHVGWHTVFIRMGIYIHTYACMLVGTLYSYVWVYIYIRMHVCWLAHCIHTCVYMHIRMHVCWLAHCIHTYGYIYIHTYACMLVGTLYSFGCLSPFLSLLPPIHRLGQCWSTRCPGVSFWCVWILRWWALYSSALCVPVVLRNRMGETLLLYSLRLHTCAWCGAWSLCSSWTSGRKRRRSLRLPLPIYSTSSATSKSLPPCFQGPYSSPLWSPMPSLGHVTQTPPPWCPAGPMCSRTCRPPSTLTSSLS